jgi:uncharacterized membrane protein YoaK (UPF0700 family)
MFAHKLNEKVSPRTYLGWFLLSFLAGNVNAGGFLSAQKFVSHVTGFATLSGISLAKGSLLEAIGLLTIPAYFLVGVMICAYLTERQSSQVRHGQRFAPVMGMVSIIMAFVAIAGQLGLFGPFGVSDSLGHDYILLALLCGSCGLQNAAITAASGHTIRTTHLTGLTTDLGLGLVRAEIHYSSAEQRQADRFANFLRIFTIAAFTLGSALGALLYVRFGYLGFLLPAALALYATWVSRAG